LKTLLGEEFTTAINGRYLKKYHPSIEVDRWLLFQASEKTKIAGIRERSRLQNKKSWQKEMANAKMCCP
jgi:hypothetical protein